MTSLLEQRRQTGSFAAGVLIGLAFVTAAFGATEADSGVWQTRLLFAAPVILALGLLLHVLVTARNLRVIWRRGSSRVRYRTDRPRQKA